jgi:hypothetical protein
LEILDEPSCMLRLEPTTTYKIMRGHRVKLELYRWLSRGGLLTSNETWPKTATERRL